MNLPIAIPFLYLYRVLLLEIANIVHVRVFQPLNYLRVLLFENPSVLSVRVFQLLDVLFVCVSLLPNFFLVLERQTLNLLFICIELLLQVLYEGPLLVEFLFESCETLSRFLKLSLDFLGQRQ
jgi:hypothetical protein